MPESTSVEKALNILLQLSSANDGVSVSQIASDLGYPPYTVVRLLQIMREMGFVWQEKPRAPYKIGYRILELAGNLLEGMELRQAARPFLHDLASKLGLVTYLKVPSGPHVVTVDVAVPPLAIAAPDEIGRRLPMHACSPGKVILAFRGDQEVDKYIQQVGLTPVTSYTITQPDVFLQEMALTRQRGYAINREESGANIDSIAAPIMRFDGKVIAAVAVSFSARQGILGTAQEQSIANEVIGAARRISFAVGYRADRLV